MCPVVLLALLLSVVLLLLELTAALSVVFHPHEVKDLKEQETRGVSFAVNDDNKFSTNAWTYKLIVDNPKIAEIVGNDTFYSYDTSGPKTSDYSFEIRGKFLGHTSLKVERKNPTTNNGDQSGSLLISVIRPQAFISNLFTVSVIALVSVNYINMGCALEVGVVLDVIKRPIAPFVGFVCQYAFMPLISYFVGSLLFDESYLRLGLFTFGCSPGGGASNMWTVLLSGNLNLSITMTFISTLAAIFMMPLWLFTLGRSIFVGTTTDVPWQTILGTLASMVFFLGVGLIFQRFVPRVARVCRKILAPVSVAMIIFIIIFGTYANLFMFKLMSWQIILATAVNVWLGFILGFTSSWVIRQPLVDRIAIAVETGVQNTGVAIVLLRLSLPQPDADLASVVPVAASVMTPIPLTLAIIVIKVRSYIRNRRKSRMFEEDVIQADERYVDSSTDKTSSSTLTRNDEFREKILEHRNWNNHV